MSKLILVNPSKAERARRIVAMITGAITIENEDDATKVKFFGELLAREKVDPKDTEAAVLCVYGEKGLHGLVRTEAEEKVAQEHATEVRKLNKGRKNKNDEDEE